MRHDDLAEVNCSVARTWSVIGERWTMMIVRELFLGRTRFDQFNASLGISRNVLADRLDALTAEGIVDQVQYDDSPRRFDYRLTEKGKDLYPILVALIGWGDRWKVEAPPMRLRHRVCEHEIEQVLRCPTCEVDVTRRDLVTDFAPDAW
ncbi:MAG: winged helix-turn-helix transcriptional regulator [Nocardioides sp.]